MPDKIPQGFDVFHLAGRRRHQLVQQPLGVDPAQRMGADAELSGIVGHDHRIADQTMMADGAPDAGLGKRADYFLVEDVDTIGGQILEKRNLIGKAPRFTCLQMRQKGGVHLTVFQKGEGGIVENIILIVAAQQGQKVQPRLRQRRAEGGEMFASDLCRMEIAIGMTGASVVDRDKGSRDQACMQHGGVLGMKAVQPLRQRPDDLAFGNLDTDIVQQGRQSLRRDLPMAMKHQAEATQTGAVAALYPCWQRCNDRASFRCHPAFAAIAHHFGPHDQIPDQAILVAFKPRSRWGSGRQYLLARGAPRLALRPATPRRLSAAGNRLVARCLVHTRGPEGWAWRQVFKPRNLIAQKLVVDLQPRVLYPEQVAFFSKLSVVSLKRLNPDFCPIGAAPSATAYQLARPWGGGASS
ncbi:hypothetical protein [Rhizobium leguminosarum]|uniref:hypothetical protein n=1 Tax=Rhizobium leguminosarum TaxID=384 RepID=UPI0021BC309A|nr:hypothetical protein [Rhizobium leguminosarum]